MSSETPKKSEASKTVGAKPGGMPDFSGLAAATRSPAPAGGIPDFSMFSGEQKKAEEVVPVAASPAKIEIAVKTAPTVAIVSDAKAKPSPSSSPNPKPAVTKPIPAPVLEIASAKIAEKATKSQAVEKKSTSATDGLVGFREFAAIAGSAVAPVISTESGTTLSPVAAKPTTSLDAIIRSTEPTKAATPNTGVGKAKQTKSAAIFGLAWIPYASDSMGFAFFAASAYQVYETLANGLPLNLAVTTILALAAAGVAMLAISLALRLLSQIADQSST